MDKNYELYFGRAANDKEYDSKKLKVFISTFVPFSKVIQDNTLTQPIKLKDSMDELDVTDNISDSNVVVCEYFDLASNRSGPPDIRQGEQVLIFHITTDDKYYWFPMGRDDNLRRLEHIKFAVSDDASIQKELTDENTYFLELDTLHNKHILIRTAKSDNESYQYTIKIDSNKNEIRLCDDTGNEILLQSDIPRIRVKNSAGAFYDLFKEDIIVASPRDIILKADRQILFNTPSFTQQAGGTMKMNADNMTFDVNNFNIGANTIGLSGALKVIGSLIVDNTIIAEGFSYGSISGGPSGSGNFSYPAGETDLSDGSSTTPQPEEDIVDTSNNRHCTAWEDMVLMGEDLQTALMNIQASFQKTLNALNEIKSSFQKIETMETNATSIMQNILETIETYTTTPLSTLISDYVTAKAGITNNDIVKPLDATVDQIVKPETTTVTNIITHIDESILEHSQGEPRI